MEYITGGAAGLVIGAVAGFLKHVFIWKGYASGEESHPAGDSGAAKLYVRMILSNLTNAAVLLAVFFVRNAVPFDHIALLAGTAFALSVSGRFMVRIYGNSRKGKGDNG